MISPRLLLAFLNLGIVAFASADVPGRTAPMGQESGHATTEARRVGALFAALDRDGDGVLSAAEIAHSSLVLRALDANEDGVLTVAEMRGDAPIRRVAPTGAVARPARTMRFGAGFTLVFALDANQDGDIQTMEIANAASSLRTLDRNGDGQLTPDELRFDLTPRSSALAMSN